jgi:Tol biopolymer transport system component
MRAMRARWTIVAAAFAVALTACSAAGATASLNPSSTSHASEAAGSMNGRIAYGQWDQTIEAYKLFTVKPDGTGVLDLQVDTDVLAWSPDGSKLLITDLVSGPGRLRPATINPDGSGLKRLDGTPDPLLDLGCHAWSPDGARIACQGFNDDHPELAGLYTLRASDGGDLVRVTSDLDLPGDYSPDGTQIVFIRQDPNAPPEVGALFVVNTDGSGLRRITPKRFALFTGGSWSPDGQWILFAHDGSLFKVHPDATGLQRIPLAHGPGRSSAGAPGWSPDGTRIVFAMARTANGSQVDIFTARADGTDLVQVTDTPDTDNQPDWGTNMG